MKTHSIDLRARVRTAYYHAGCCGQMHPSACLSAKVEADSHLRPSVRAPSVASFCSTHGIRALNSPRALTSRRQTRERRSAGSTDANGSGCGGAAIMEPPHLSPRARSPCAPHDGRDGACDVEADAQIKKGGGGIKLALIWWTNHPPANAVACLQTRLKAHNPE